MRPPDPRLLIVPSLAYGGMELQMIELARALGRRGGSATIMAADGPLAAQAREVAEVELTDWSRPREETAGRAAELVRGGVAVLPADPVLAHLVEPLAAAGLVHLCVHNRPGTFEGWFPPDVLAELLASAPRLHASRRVAFTASSSPNAVAHALGLGLPPGSIRAWFPGVDAPAGGEVAAGPVRRVAVVTRLSPEKLPILASAALLVAAGLEAGADVVLDVHGEGPAEDATRELLAQHLPPDRFRLLGATPRPLEALADAGAVVNAGRSAIEALLVGRRVVTPLLDPLGRTGVGPPVSPESFADFKERNFVWSGEPQDPRAVWEEMIAMPGEALRALRECARRELSSEALLDAHLAAMAQRGPAPAQRHPLRFAAREASGLAAGALAYTGLLRAGVPYVAAAAAGAGVAALNAGAWHHRTTFRGGRLRGTPRRRFWLVQAGGAAVATGLTAAVVERLDVPRPIAQPLGAAPVVALVLAANRRWTFR